MGDFFRGFGKTRQMAKLQRRATMRAADDAAFLAASGVGQLGGGDEHGEGPCRDDLLDHPMLPHAPFPSAAGKSGAASSTPRKRRYHPHRVTASMHARSSGHDDHKSGGLHHDEHRAAYHELRFKQSELSRRVSVQMNAGGHNVVKHHRLDESSSRGHHMTRRISNADLSLVGHRHPSIPWFEAVSHSDPGTHITDAETAITQSSILHQETQFIRAFAMHAKKLADLHLKQSMSKEHAQVRSMSNKTQKLTDQISSNAMISDCVAAIINRTERAALKENLRTKSVRRGKDVLDTALANRKTILKEIYDRRMSRRQSLDDSFTLGRDLMARMTRVLQACSDRLAHQQQLELLDTMHATGLMVGRVSNHEGVSMLHSKVALVMEMTHHTMEVFDGGLTVVVSDEVMAVHRKNRKQITSLQHRGLGVASKAMAQLIDAQEWVCSLANHGPARHGRRDEPHRHLALVETELTTVLGYQLPQLLDGYENGTKTRKWTQNDDSIRTNVSPEYALRALARVLDAVHPIPGRRISGAIAKAPHRMAKILSDRCELLGFGSFLSLFPEAEQNPYDTKATSHTRGNGKRMEGNISRKANQASSIRPESGASASKQIHSLPSEGPSESSKADVAKVLTLIHSHMRDYTRFMFEWHPFLQATSVAMTADVASTPGTSPNKVGSNGPVAHPPPPTASKHQSRGRVPWIVGLVDPSAEVSDALQSYPGLNRHGFGLSSLGTIHHDGRLYKYCNPSTLASCEVIGMVVDLVVGSISFSADGKHLGVAFGPDAECFANNATAMAMHRKLITEKHLVATVALADRIWEEGVWRSAAAGGSGHGEEDMSEVRREFGAMGDRGGGGVMHQSFANRLRNSSFESEASFESGVSTSAMSKNKKDMVTFEQPAMSVNFGGFAFVHPQDGVCGFDSFLSFSETPAVPFGMLNTSKIGTIDTTQASASHQDKDDEKSHKNHQRKNKKEKSVQEMIVSDNMSVKEVSDAAIRGIRDRVNFLKRWTPEEELSWSIYSPEPGVPHFLEVAARKLQAFTRRAMGRKWRHGTRFLMYLSIVKVQRLIRRQMPRIKRKKRKAATRIQAHWRARMARMRMLRIYEFSQFPAWEVDGVLTGAAVRLQCVVRMSQARRRFWARKK